MLSLKSRLKKEGIIILTTPNGYGWFEFEKFMYEKLGLKFLFKFFNRIIHINKLINPQELLPLTTLNKENKHLQKFTYKKLKSLFNKTVLYIIGESRAGIFGGQFLKFYLAGANHY